MKFILAMVLTSACGLASAVTVSPGGQVHLSGPITVTAIDKTNNSTFESYSCTATATATVTPSNGAVSINANTFSVASCSNDGGYATPIQDEGTWTGTTYVSGNKILTNLSVALQVNDTSGFGPLPYVDCSGTITGISWGNTGTTASQWTVPASTIPGQFGGGNSAACVISGTLYLNPSQTHSP